jgi:hypothetical protein
MAEINWFEQGAVNMMTAFSFGTIYGGTRYYWTLISSSTMESKSEIFTLSILKKRRSLDLINFSTFSERFS